MNIKAELVARRDELLSSLRIFLSIKVMTQDVDGFKDFIKYINRYTASEVQFLIEEHGFKGDIDLIIDKIEEKIRKEVTDGNKKS